MRSALALFSWLLLCLPAFGAPSVEFDRYEEGVLLFKVGEGTQALARLKVDLHDLQLLGKMETPDDGIPYFLFTGKPCADCIQDSFVYLIQPSAEAKTYPSPMMTFVHPGRILDSKDRSLLLESRAFFGRCLANVPSDVYVVFQKERIDRRRGLQSSVFMAQPTKDKVSEKLIEKRLPSMNETLRRVKRKECREIDGRYRVMLRKPLDLRYLSKTKGSAKNPDDDEDEKSEKSEGAGGPETPVPSPSPRPGA